MWTQVHVPVFNLSERRERMAQRYVIVQAAIKAQFGSQRNFADREGLTELQLSQLLTGRKKLTETTKTRWCQILQTPKHILFPELEEEPGEERKEV